MIVEMLNPLDSQYADQREILTAEACEFLQALHNEFEPRRVSLLEMRRRRQELLDAGETPGFLPRPNPSGILHGQSRQFPMNCLTGEWKSPDQPSARW